MEMLTLESPRLILRPWREQDRPGFAAMNADPGVMTHFPAPLSRDESDGFMDRIGAHFDRLGWGFWAVERRDTGELAGLCGLAQIPWETLPWDERRHPVVEIGWRFGSAHQRQGFAEEAARAALSEGFGPLGMEEIIAFTIPDNLRSWGLMERLGMRREGHFEHPRLPEGHKMRRHLLYNLTRRDWQRSAA